MWWNDVKPTITYDEKGHKSIVRWLYICSLVVISCWIGIWILNPWAAILCICSNLVILISIWLGINAFPPKDESKHD